MDATTLIMHNCYNAAYEKLHNHFQNRNIFMSLSCEFVRGKKTRKYQHFQVLADFYALPLSPYGDELYRVVIDGYYNLEGNLQYYIKLGKFDKFGGAADFNPLSGRFLYHWDDIVRSFADISPTERLAIIKV